LKRVDADAVVISSPVTYHAEQVDAAIDAGKHVMVEKPFTVDLAQAERAVKKAEQRGVKIVVGQNMRYLAPVRTMARLIRERAYGRPGYFNHVFHKVRPTPYNLSPHQQLWQMSVHDLDSIRSLFSERVKRVTCREVKPPWTKYQTPPCVEALLEFEGGLTGVYLGSSDSKHRNYILRVECEQAALFVPAYPGKLFVGVGNEEKELPADTPPENRDFNQMIPYVFHEYVTTGVEPDISGRNNLETMRLCDACIRSSENGETVEL
jgi:predicted dehydrogenase